MNTRRLIASTSALMLAAAASHAQTMVITGHERYIEGTVEADGPAGPMSQGPVRSEADPANLWYWDSSPYSIGVSSGNSVSVTGRQAGGFDGINTIQLDTWQTSITAAGAPGTSGTAHAIHRFAYSFEILEPASYTLRGLFGGQIGVTEITFNFTGPGVSISENSTSYPNNTIEAFQNGIGGPLVPGNYTIALHGVAHITYGGGSTGGGGGMGGSSPILEFIVEPGSPACYANCDGSTVEPVLNVDDFTCFINEFAAAQSLPHAEQIEHYANCDASTIAPVLNVDDFTCFINAFAAGCP